MSIVVKFYKTVGTQLEMSQYEKLVKICDKEGCRPYAILKDLLTDYLESYPLKEDQETPQKTLDKIGDGLNEPAGQDEG